MLRERKSFKRTFLGVINYLSSRSYCWHRMKRYQVNVSDTSQNARQATLSRKARQKKAWVKRLRTKTSCWRRQNEILWVKSILNIKNINCSMTLEEAPCRSFSRAPRSAGFYDTEAHEVNFVFVFKNFCTH